MSGTSPAPRQEVGHSAGSEARDIVGWVGCRNSAVVERRKEDDVERLQGTRTRGGQGCGAACKSLTTSTWPERRWEGHRRPYTGWVPRRPGSAW